MLKYVGLALLNLTGDANSIRNRTQLHQSNIYNKFESPSSRRNISIMPISQLKEQQNTIIQITGRHEVCPRMAYACHKAPIDMQHPATRSIEYRQEEREAKKKQNLTKHHQMSC